MNVFEVVKGNVTARQAAEAHGLKVSRTDMACCPFHSEKSPSMKLAERYYCFGCGVGIVKFFGDYEEKSVNKIFYDNDRRKA